MTMIDNMFCLHLRVIYKCEMLSVITLEQHEITGTYNTPDTVVRDRRTK